MSSSGIGHGPSQARLQQKPMFWVADPTCLSKEAAQPFRERNAAESAATSNTLIGRLSADLRQL
jgi:hypothetical protein